MIKKVNKNKFGVIEYLIEDMEDLKNLPKEDTNNTTYAIMRKGNEKIIYLYSSSTKEWVSINEDSSSIKSSLENKADKDHTHEPQANCDTVDNLHFVCLTKSEYDALETKDSNTLYFIKKEAE